MSSIVGSLRIISSHEKKKEAIILKMRHYFSFSDKFSPRKPAKNNREYVQGML